MDPPPLHLLLVEDDDAHAMIVERGFRASNSGGTLDRVADGTEAIAYVRRQAPYGDRPRPSVILLDWNLPRMNGQTVLATLKSDEEFKSIPVVVLTTSDADRDVAKAYRLHANSYLVKPVEFAEFREMIRAVTSYWGVWNHGPCNGKTGNSDHAPGNSNHAPHA